MSCRVLVLFTFLVLLMSFLMMSQTCLADSANASVEVRISRVIQVNDAGAARSNVSVLKQIDSAFVTFVTP
ncbi:MAG: hypothetical protein KJ907_08340 [Actinobacteria bacterium]|nr:hypothetical protein [Actinomycetota bacterium]